MPSDKYFRDDDTFLINDFNDGGRSKRVTAKMLKDVVNPTGNIDKPVIEYPTDEQGFPVNSSEIEINNNPVTDTNIVLTMKDFSNLSLIGPEGAPLNEPINSTEAYKPLTTIISRVVDLGGGRTELFFNSINYDYYRLKMGDKVVSTLSQLEGTIVQFNTVPKSIVITTTADWSRTLINSERVFVDREITSSGVLTKYLKEGVPGKEKYNCYITVDPGSEPWVDSYNGRGQRMTFDTTLPKGGSHVDMEGSVFVASRFVCDNPLLKLTDVFWRVNGVEYKVPVVDPQAKQTWEVPNGALTPDIVNQMTVTYKSGYNSSTSEIKRFIPSHTPFKIGNTVALFDALEVLTADVTDLGL